MLESWPARVVGSTATPPFGGLSPNRHNSTLSLRHFWPRGDIKTEARVRVTYDHLLALHETENFFTCKHKWDDNKWDTLQNTIYLIQQVYSCSML